MESPFSIAALEFDKVRDILTRYVTTDPAREKILTLTPRTDPEWIRFRLQENVEMRDCLMLDDAIPLDSLQDTRPLIAKLRPEGQFLNAGELLKCRRFLETSRRVKSFFLAREAHYPRLAHQTAHLSVLKKEEDRIAAIVSDEGEILDSASPELRRIRAEIDQAGRQLRKRMESLAREYVTNGYAQEAIVTMRDGRMVIPVKDEFKHSLRGFVHDASASGQTIFMEPAEALELNNTIRMLQSQEIREVERILTVMTAELRTHRQALEANADVLAEMEVIYAKGRLAETLQCSLPELRTDGRILIRKGRHPLLTYKEQMKPAAERREVVPLDLQIGSTDIILIISGPNAGGKTVALKTVGLLVLMVQCGLLIPAEDSEVSIFDNIVADIGDEQSIENDLSTFSSHVRNLAAMSRLVNHRTLVLIDELGSGTDPREGAALSISFLNHLLRRRAVAIITTHHGELKAFAHETPGIRNGSMEFDQATLAPTYVFRDGIPGSSYAFDIAQRMGLDGDLIAEARRVAGADSQRLDRLITDLQARIREYENMERDTRREKSRVDGLAAFYDVRARELKTRERQLKKSLAEERERLLRETNRKIEEWIKKIREEQASADAIRAVKSELQQTRSDLQRDRTVEEEEPHANYVPRKGDRVRIRGMDVEGTVADDPERSGLVTVVSGSLQIRVSVNELLPSEKGAAVIVAKETIDWDTEEIRQELDLRGMTSEEAILEVDRYISDAHALGLMRLSLIHGKGDGILRRKIGEFLKKNQRVEKFRLGEWGEGDTGVTIVELRND